MNLHRHLEEIRRWIGHRRATSYTKEGCRVSMASIPSERVVLDVDLAFPTDRADTNQCDFVLFYIDTSKECLVGVPMELKGSTDASKIIQQLQEGARIIDRLASNTVKTVCIPIAFHRRKIHKAQLKKLKTSRVTFRGEEFPINTTRCSYEGNLAQALSKSTQR
ncbi:MAG: hypothetical protein OXN25_09265 [Candidatus Poribacteria bacterium]|nr:hypothetical protein [Candidatus Poribacteria bacterium]